MIVTAAPTVAVPVDVWQQILDALARKAATKSCEQYVHDAYAAAESVTG